MDCQNDVRNLVIVGYWNIFLFSPKWLNDNVFDGKLPKDIKIDFSISNNITSHKTFHLPDFKLEISIGRICFIANEQNPETYDKIIEKANQILTKLPHTPVTSFGINFKFVIKEYPLLEKLSVLKEINKKFTILKEATETFSFQQSENPDMSLNVTVNKKIDNLIIFNLNYSHKVEDISGIKEHLNLGSITEYFNSSKEIINTILEKLYV